jgi:hypothetical protein
MPAFLGVFVYPAFSSCVGCAHLRSGLGSLPSS